MKDKTPLVKICGVMDTAMAYESACATGGPA